MKDLDNLDRFPTKFERFIGAIASLFISLFVGTIVGFGIFFVVRTPSKATPIVIVVLFGLSILALWAARMFVRIARGKPQRPGYRGQLVIGLVATVGGAAYLCVSALQSDVTVPAGVFMATVVLVSGIAWARHAWKHLRASEA
jgi:hypothetical protein